ncbi:DnaJ subfamily C member 17 [Nymphon striatum]|nr:DnaJ subfamily C member 17 [Nymphon striatum]
MTDLTNLDLYDLLAISIEATEKEIKKAYRKKALKCHPDKNPDNAKAADLFHQLSKALEILTDCEAKAAYDKLLKARKAAEIRNRELDSKRRKLKDDLEAREKLAQVDVICKSDARDLQIQIERLRKEGSKQLEEERELLRRELLQEQQEKQKQTGKELSATLKLKWKAKKGDFENNGGYSHELLERFFSKYGDITCIIVSKKKVGSALIQFPDIGFASDAFYNEIGIMDNPLQYSWIQGQPLPKQTYSSMSNNDCSSENHENFEEIVLAKLAEAAKKQKLERNSLNNT